MRWFYNEPCDGQLCPYQIYRQKSIRKSIESNGKEILDGNTPQDLTWPQPGQNHHSTRSKTYHRHLSTNEGVMLVCYYLEAMRLYCQRQRREENFCNAWGEFFFFSLSLFWISLYAVCYSKLWQIFKQKFKQIEFESAWILFGILGL